jgi:hypothetical protein
VMCSQQTAIFCAVRPYRGHGTAVRALV